MQRSRFIILAAAAVIGGTLGVLLAGYIPALTPPIFDGGGARELAVFLCAAVYATVKPLLFMFAAGYTVYAAPVSIAVTALTSARLCSFAALKLGAGVNIAAIITLPFCAASIYFCLCSAARTAKFSSAVRCGLSDAKTLFFSRPSARYLSDTLTLTGLFMTSSAAIFALIR